MIDSIAHELANLPPAADETPFAASLASGEAGFALFFHHVGDAIGGLDGAELAELWLDRAIERLGSSVLGPGLFEGFTGVAWVAERLHSGASADDDRNTEIDEVLIDLLARSPWHQPYDLVSGLVGLGTYALERWPRPIARRALELVVGRLEELAEEVGSALAWPSPSDEPAPPSGVWYPNGRYNLGVAHGVPGVWPVLAGAIACGVAVHRARRLLEGSLRWVFDQRLPAGDTSIFPYAVGPGAEVRPARSAWCYGDPGIALALFWTARSIASKEWESEALALARAVAVRDREVTAVRDAGLCHGAAGLGHQFNRLFQATGDPILGKAARHWFDETLELWQPGRGFAGVESWAPDATGSMGWRADPSVLTGAAGVALALHAASTLEESSWDRFLLLSPLCNSA